MNAINIFKNYILFRYFKYVSNSARENICDANANCTENSKTTAKNVFIAETVFTSPQRNLSITILSTEQKLLIIRHTFCNYTRI